MDKQIFKLIFAWTATQIKLPALLRLLVLPEVIWGSWLGTAPELLQATGMGFENLCSCNFELLQAMRKLSMTKSGLQS